MNPADRDIPVTRTARNGRVLLLRHMTAEDVAPTLAFVNGLSYADSYFRFGRGGFKLTESDMLRQCGADPLVSRHYIVVARDNAGERVVANADSYRIGEREAYEFAVAVAEGWRGHGLARWLIARLAEDARDAGARYLVAEAMSSNARMLGFARRMGFSLAKQADNPTLTKMTLAIEG